MKFPSLTWAVLAAVAAGLANCGAAEDKPLGETSRVRPRRPSNTFLWTAPAGMSQAVIVKGLPLVHTRQLLPLDRGGRVVGEGSVDKQIEQVLANLQAVLIASGSRLDKLVRLNVYAIEPRTIDRVRELLAKRLPPSVRPAIAAVLTPLTRHKALVALDAVAVAASDLGSAGRAVGLHRCQAVAGNKQCADAAVLPPGGVAYLSGQREKKADSRSRPSPSR